MHFCEYCLKKHGKNATYLRVLIWEINFMTPGFSPPVGEFHAILKIDHRKERPERRVAHIVVTIRWNVYMTWQTLQNKTKRKKWKNTLNVNKKDREIYGMSFNLDYTQASFKAEFTLDNGWSTEGNGKVFIKLESWIFIGLFKRKK